MGTARYMEPEGPMNCPFCEAIATGAATPIGEGIYRLLDRYPVTKGHALYIPTDHIATASELPEGVLASLFEAASLEGTRMRAAGQCDDYNLGLNDGPAAGQTISHLHVHLIPRRPDDSLDPRGGVRWVIPAKADYWSAD